MCKNITYPATTSEVTTNGSTEVHILLLVLLLLLKLQKFYLYTLNKLHNLTTADSGTNDPAMPER